MRSSLECSITRSVIGVELPDDWQTMLQGWDKSVAIQCPHCGREYRARYRDMYVEGVISGLAGDLNELLRVTTQS